jgi:hypothetical protein
VSWKKACTRGSAKMRAVSAEKGIAIILGLARLKTQFRQEVNPQGEIVKLLNLDSLYHSG